jgi:hypothetical protein
MAAVAVRLSANSTHQPASHVTVLLAAPVVMTGIQDQPATRVHRAKSAHLVKLVMLALIGHLSVPAVSLAALPVASATQDLLVMTAHRAVTLVTVMPAQPVTLVLVMIVPLVVILATVIHARLVILDRAMTDLLVTTAHRAVTLVTATV